MSFLFFTALTSRCGLGPQCFVLCARARPFHVRNRPQKRNVEMEPTELAHGCNHETNCSVPLMGVRLSFFNSWYDFMGADVVLLGVH